MKKVLFTSILLLSAVSFGGNIYAQNPTGGNNMKVTARSASQPSVKFTADGNTLTISGQGDLTSYMTTDWSAKVFTDKAVGFVFTDADGKTPVAAGDSYNAGKTYYHAEYNYTKVWEGQPVAWNTYFGTVTAERSWKDNKKANLYMATIDAYNKNVTVGNKVSDNVNWDQEIFGGDWNYTIIDGKKYVKVVEVTGEVPTSSVSFDNLQASGIKLIEVSELQSDFINTKVTYQIKDKLSLFLSSDGGKTYKGLTSGVDYEWTSGDVFYQGTATYAAIKDNNAFFDNVHTGYVQADNTEISFKELLRRKILEGVSVYDYNAQTEVGVSSYTTVKFVNNGSDPLLIDADVVRGILYPTSNGMLTTNVTTTKLDLGEATLNELNADIFIPSHDESYKCHKLALNDITFPKTKLTLVFSESTKQDENKMVLPAHLLSNITGKIKTVSIPKGYDRIADGAFSNENAHSVLENVNLPKGLTLIGASAFENCTGLTSIVLNEGLENIGEKAFASCKLKDLKFPSTLKIINDGAFYNVYVTNLKLNAGLEFIGNSAFALASKVDKDAVENVVEIPASVKYIGPAAFEFRTYQDVYFYGEKAPLMPLGDSKYNTQGTNVTAFYAESLMGFGGFDKGSNREEGELKDNAGEGYANRENYKKSTGAYFCILHFPKGLTPAQQAAYSDTTRVYKTVEEGKTFHYGKTDTNPDTYYTAGQEQEPLKWYNSEQPASKTLDYGFQDTYLGRQYVWPSQEAWLRSYIVSSNGYNWNGVTPYRPELTADDLATLAYAGYKQADVTDVEKGEYTLDDLKKIAHLGTRQFVLANADVNVDKEEDKEPEYPISLETGKWWTLCVPFNMTKKQVLETFGEDTQLCLFSAVERHTGNGHNSIVLKFTQDVLNHSTTDSDGNKYKGEDGKWLPIDDDDIVKNDDEVVVWAHESYMIKPMKGKNSDKEPTFVVKNYTPVVGNPLPTVVEAHVVKDPLQEADYSNEYRFIGNYLGSTDEKPVVIPQYSYIYAKTGSDPTYKFRFYTGTKATWSPNKSIVQSHDRQGGYRDYKNFFGSDKSTMPQGAKQASIFGEEDFGETTGIDNVTIIAGSDVLTPIFTLDGKLVSVNGNVEGLAKGVYVKAGKKFVVK